MSLTTTASTRTYDCNGAAAFPVPFRFLAPTDLVVTHLDVNGAEEPLELGVDFTVTGAGGPAGGTVTLLDPPDDGEIRIDRVVALTQPLSLQSGGFSPVALEQAFDRMAMQTQEVKRDATEYVNEREAVIRADFNVLENAVATMAVVTAQASAASASASQAAASEGAAQTQADLAAGAEMGALAAQVAAEAARDQAEGATGIYDSTALGLVATPDGGYFKVPDGVGGFITYRDTAGVAVEVGRVAAGAVVSELVASVPPRSTDSGGHLDYAADSAGRVYRYTKADGGLMLQGRSEAVQTRLADLDNVTVQEPTTTVQDVAVDGQGNVIRYADSAGDQHLPGLEESVQAALRRVEETANLLYRPTGGVVIPTTFTPMAKALRPEERFVWSGMPAHLRPAPTSRVVTAYPFSWEDTGVIALPADMKRRRGVINPPGSFDPVTWTHLEDLTVNAPPGFFDPVDPYYTRSWRDASIMYDRKLGKYWWADSGIGRTADGWPQLNIPIFDSTDGLTFNFVGYTPNVSGPSDFNKKMISPDWFIDSDGGVYLIVDGYHTGAGPRTYIILKCTTPDTMLTWEEVGDITGTALPTSTASGGQVDIIDPYIFQRHGVYYVIWKAERAGTEDATQIGIAWADSILGPYNHGHRFLDPYGNKIKGQGMSVTELPPGGPYRYRLWFDKYGPDVYPGMTSAAQQACVDTNDFTTFGPVRGVNIHPTIRQHTTYVIGF